MANEEAKLFVAGLPDSISEEVLKQLFEATGGKVAGVSLPKDRLTGRPRGFGFVTMATPEEAQAARDALDGSMQAGKSISVRPFQAEPPKRDAVGPRIMGAPPGPRGPGGNGGGFEQLDDRQRVLPQPAEHQAAGACQAVGGLNSRDIPRLFRWRGRPLGAGEARDPRCCARRAGLS